MGIASPFGVTVEHREWLEFTRVHSSLRLFTMLRGRLE